MKTPQRKARFAMDKAVMAADPDIRRESGVIVGEAEAFEEDGLA